MRILERGVVAAIYYFSASGAIAADNPVKFSVAGDWTVFKDSSHNRCYAAVPGFPPRTQAVEDVLTLLYEPKGYTLSLYNQKFNFPPGNFAIRFSHNGSPYFDGSLIGTVLPGWGKTILLPLKSSDDVRAFSSATNATITLGSKKHFFSTEGMEDMFRALSNCMSNKSDPFASDR